MTITVADVYAQLQNVALPVPGKTDTVIVARVSPTGTVWSVPTRTFSVLPPTKPITSMPVIHPIGTPPPNTPPPRPPETTSIQAAVVRTTASDLVLRFELAVPDSAVTISVYPGGRPLIVGSPSQVRGAQIATATATPGQTVLDLDVGPSASSTANEGGGPILTGWFTCVVAMAGAKETTYDLAILRPPVLNAGVFTIPALPRTIIYAPPQSSAGGCYCQYQLQTSVTRSFTTSVSNGTSTKTAQAYMAADFVAKIASVITEVAAVVAGVATLAGATGATSTSGSSASSGSDSGGTDKAITLAGSLLSNGLSLISNIITGFETQTTSNTTQSVQTTSSTTWTFTPTDTTTWKTNSTIGGPGVADLFIYDLNVRIAYLIWDGQLHMYVLGCDTPAAQHPVADLKAGVTGLDASSVSALLALDPLVNGWQPGQLATRLSLTTLGFMGSSVTTGNQVTCSYAETEDDSTSSTQQVVNVIDTKPGWLTALFGAGNTETTTTTTLTLTSTQDTKSTTTITETLGYQTANGEEYYVDIYYDRLFQSLLVWPHPAS